MTIENIVSQLKAAQDRLERLTVQRDAIVTRDANRHWTETDSAIGSGIRRKANPKADARRYAGYTRDAQVFADHAEAEKRVEVLKARLSAAIEERDRTRYTRDDLIGATAVRTRLYGWRLVRRVNQKTISVDSGYSWADHVKFEDVLAFTKAEVKRV